MIGDLIMIDDKICVLLTEEENSITVISVSDILQKMMFYGFEIDCLQKLSDINDIDVESLICTHPDVSVHKIRSR